MTNATAAHASTEKRSPAKRGNLWTPEDVAVINRLRKDLTAEKVDWRTEWENIGPKRIQDIVDELYPGPSKCGVGRAYRIQKLIPVVPEDLPDSSSAPAPPAAAAPVFAPEPEPEPAPVAPTPVDPEPEPPAEPEPIPEPEPTPEPESEAPAEDAPKAPERSGRLARLRARLRRPERKAERPRKVPAPAPRPAAPAPTRAKAPATPEAPATPLQLGRLRLIPPVASLGLSAIMQVIIVTDVLGHSLIARYDTNADNRGAFFAVAFFFGIGIACALEGAAAYLLDLYRKHLLARDSVFTLRLLLIAYVGGSGALIHWWTGNPKVEPGHLPWVLATVLSVLAGSSVLLWIMGSKWENRERMRANGQLDPAMPRLSTPAKLFHPVRWVKTMWLVSWEPAETAEEARARYAATKERAT